MEVVRHCAFYTTVLSLLININRNLTQVQRTHNIKQTIKQTINKQEIILTIFILAKIEGICFPGLTNYPDRIKRETSNN